MDHALDFLGFQDRINVLVSEVKRYKAQLAVKAGNEDLLTFFFQDCEGGPSYIEDLKNRATSVPLIVVLSKF